jgi:crotonobetainyl-CoA:carnitine CoA-transferase CaiB-like acyl-CoA transferase
MQAALVALAGLLRRDRSGAGGFFDVSLSESVLAWQAMALTAARRPGFAPQRAAGLLNGGAACYQVYETADRRFATLGALEAKFWAAFCRAVGHEAWIVRQNDSLPQSELIGEVAALFAGRPLAHWSALLEDVDCCFHPVMEPLELPEHAQLRARGLVRAGEGPEPLVEVLFPAFLDGAGPAPRKPLHEAQVAAVLESWQAG